MIELSEIFRDGFRGGVVGFFWPIRWVWARVRGRKLLPELRVEQCRSGQWRWLIVDPHGYEVCAGGGYADEADAWSDGSAELGQQIGIE